MLEVIYKYLLIVFMITLLAILAYSGFLFHNGVFSVDMLLLHKRVGFLLLFFIFLHVFTKKKKLKKLTKEFLNIFTNKKVSIDSNMDILLESLSSKTLLQISQLFNMEIKILEDLLIKNDVIFFSKYDTLQNISDKNSTKIFFLIVRILEVKAQKI